MATQSAFVEFQNLGFECIDGNELVYPSAKNISVTEEMLPNVRSLSGIKRISTGNCNLPRATIKILRRRGVIVLDTNVPEELKKETDVEKTDK